MNILSGLNILDNLDDKEKENLSSFCQERLLNSGEVLFKQGESADSMYILKSGNISISKMIGNKKSILGNVSGESILGEMALFGNNRKRMATATATSDCVLVTLLDFSIKEITKKHPDLLDKIMSIIESRVLKNKIIENQSRFS